MGNSLSCWQAAQLHKSLAIFTHSKSLMLRGQYALSLLLAPSHGFAQAAEQRESCDSSPEAFQGAVDHPELRVTAVRPALPSPDQSGAGRLWLTLKSRGFSAQLSFLWEMIQCEIPAPLCVLFKTPPLTLLHSVVSDPLHPTEGFRSQVFRAMDRAKQSQTPKCSVRTCPAREQQCPATMLSKVLWLSRAAQHFPASVSLSAHVGGGKG